MRLVCMICTLVRMICRLDLSCIHRPSVRPVERDILISDPLAIRVKDENQLIEELDKLAREVLNKYPQIGTTIEEQ